MCTTTNNFKTISFASWLGMVIIMKPHRYSASPLRIGPCMVRTFLADSRWVRSIWSTSQFEDAYEDFLYNNFQVNIKVCHISIIIINTSASTRGFSYQISCGFTYIESGPQTIVFFIFLMHYFV